MMAGSWWQSDAERRQGILGPGCDATYIMSLGESGFPPCCASGKLVRNRRHTLALRPNHWCLAGVVALMMKLSCFVCSVQHGEEALCVLINRQCWKDMISYQ